MQTVRMRDNYKVIELDISAEKIADVKYIQENFFGNKSKSKYLKQVLGHSLCCLCASGIPSVKLEYDLTGFTKVEYYCPNCISKCYERAAEPEDRDELAAFYGCTALDGLPETPGYKEGKEVIPK